MKKPTLHQFLRPLIALFGAALGGGLAALCIRMYLAVESAPALAPAAMLAICAAMTLLCAALSWLFAHPIILRVKGWTAAMEQAMRDKPLWQLLCGALGLVIGLVVAALISQLFQAWLPDLLWTVLSAILYLMAGSLGLSIGLRRWRELPMPFFGKGSEMKREPGEGPIIAPKILDTSALIDGRILDVCRTGFVEGPLWVPQFILTELQHIADSTDPTRRNRGKRGLAVLQKMQKELSLPMEIIEGKEETSEVDVRLLKLCKASGGAIITNDYNLNKVAEVTGVQVLNINDLAGALRPALLPGEEMQVHILKEGKEHGQGVGYLDDGTMIVVDSGRSYIGQRVAVLVTTVLQTSAGRMIFTKMKDAA